MFTRTRRLRIEAARNKGKKPTGQNFSLASGSSKTRWTNSRPSHTSRVRIW